MVAATCWLAGCVATARVTAPPPAPDESTPGTRASIGSASPASWSVAELEARSARLRERASWIESRYEHDLEPLTEILTRPGFAGAEDEGLKVRIALAIERESRATGISAELLASVLVVENPWLDLDRRSPVGAVGLMQVMPFHAGEWGPCAQRLDDVDSNICHGARIFAHYLGTTNGDVDRALLRYNGCVNGTNTPDCDRYPTRVFARAGRASLWSWTRPAAAASR